MADLENCLNPSCGQLVKHKSHRGLCPRCYQDASYLVNSKKTTWLELEAKGKVLSPSPTRPDPHETEAMKWMLE